MTSDSWVGGGSTKPYFVWRRDDGYVAASRAEPGRGFQVLGEFAYDDWASARDLIEKERERGR